MVAVPVEEIRQGDRIVLPSPGGRNVDVQRVDTYPDDAAGDLVYFVRWASGGKFTQGHRLAGERVEVGSLKPLHAGDPVEVSR